ncbi:MAG: SH3 domain-containing protein [Chloroflexi bacterium]|nr:SH3 domain-containing protein [Candidatus Roseilinea sp. NK_OTU-006]RMG61928.1 MAG: SH3 domain-containing protein [Chloroflexota bacterium]
MPTRLAHLVRLICLASLTLAACASGGGPNLSREATSRILTAVATRTTAPTPRAAASSTISSPTEAASLTPTEPTATPLPPMVFARCIVRAESPMRQEPEDAARVTAPLQPSDIVTAYGRTANGQWILIWNREIAFGWIPSGVLGCSAPFGDLRPTEPDVLLTPRPTVTPPALMADAKTALPTPAAVAAAVTETPTPLATQTPEPAVTEAPPAPAPDANAPATVMPTPETTAFPTAAVGAAESPAEPLACIVAIDRALNLRAGPDRTTRLLGQLRPGATFNATGRNADATWLYGTTARGNFAWVIASALRCEGDPGGLRVVAGN